jgi:hypothetical protein
MDTEMPYKLMFKAICKYHAWKERLHFKVSSFVHLISDIDFVIDFQKCYMNNRNIKCYISFKFTQNIFKKQLYIKSWFWLDGRYEAVTYMVYRLEYLSQLKMMSLFIDNCILFFFTQLAKIQVNFCHHLVSVILC